ncbi:hypothetical protein P3T27_006662 [Kitasatospora sp. MAA19]|uniref:hypothetical protein n=1 Tax=Kitasatospora sp. MAA19 TaxID=3035090 RepID=UPI00247503DF|nr:hypothetical protein [Kitasatospora sp. MAA19]MDH6709913.1 hypothetical protein [Kitasatospora sp. MAA19]
MRPARFQQLLLDAAAGLPGVSAKTFADAGHTRHPFGVAVEAGGRTSLWQVIGVGAPGEKWYDAEPAPVLGTKPAPMDAPAPGNHLASVERALVAALLAADPGEIAAVEVYSGLPTAPAVGRGATIDFHDGSQIFINHVR